MQVKVLQSAALYALMNDQDIILVDIRPKDDFSNGFIAGSCYLPDISLLPFILPMDDVGKTAGVVLIGTGQENDEVAEQLAQALGSRLYGIYYYGTEDKGPIEEGSDLIIAIEPDELAMDIQFDESLVLLDLSTANEFAEGHIVGAMHFPLENLGDPANIALLPENGNIYLYSRDVKRSMVAASVYKKHGLHNLRVINASWEDIVNTPGLKLEKDTKQLN